MTHVIGKTATILFATVSFVALAHAQMERYDVLANTPMVENRPTPETAKLLKDELLFQRATQTYLWAPPLINTRSSCRPCTLVCDWQNATELWIPETIALAAPPAAIVTFSAWPEA